MNLEQKSEAQFFTFQSPIFPISVPLQPQKAKKSSQIHFSHDYASFQQMTDAQRNDFSQKQTESKKFQFRSDDFIDQFLSFHRNDSNSEQLIQRQYSKTQLSPQITSIKPQLPETTNAPNAFTNNHIQEAILPIPPQTDSFRSLSKDYNKNLAGYITKKALRIMTSASYRKRLDKFCLSKNVQPNSILEYCRSHLSSIFGPNSIFQFFSVSSQAERPMKQVLLAIFTRILRKDYTLEILNEGRMLNYEAYVKIKNSHLLYFSLLLP